VSPRAGASSYRRSARSAAKSSTDNLTKLPGAVAPFIARQAAEKMPTAIVDHHERLSAFFAGLGHSVGAFFVVSSPA
jgi:hypothetical protein